MTVLKGLCLKGHAWRAVDVGLDKRNDSGECEIPVVTENLIRYIMSRSAPIVVVSCASETTSILL
jgi:hypothetical protein